MGRTAQVDNRPVEPKKMSVQPAPRTARGDQVFGSNLRHLQIFRVAATLQSIHRTATVVHLSQPAVTQAIAKLEAMAQTVLFERRSSGVYLTQPGELLAARIARMFEQLESALASVGIAAASARGGSLVGRLTRSHIHALDILSRGDLQESSDGRVSNTPAYRSVKQLERILGKRLLLHGVNGLATTELGSYLAGKFNIAMLEIEAGLEDISSAAAQKGGHLRIGAMHLTGSLVVPPVLDKLTTAFPSARIDVRFGERKTLVRALQRGEIDIVVGLLWGGGNSTDIVREPLVSLPYVIVGRSGHPLTRQPRMSLEDLGRYGWIAPTLGTARRAAFDRLASSLAHAPQIHVRASALPTVRLLLAESDRLALVTRLEFDHEKSSGVLAALPFDFIEPTHILGMIWRANWSPTALNAKFMELMRLHGAGLA